jgi:Ca2+:H+ antiporter
MIVLYILGLIYSYKVIGGPVVVDEAVTESAHKGWSLRMGIAVLAVSTVGVAFLSEVFVGAVEPVVSTLGISEFFIGLIFIPIIGNVAEHLVAVQVALKNKMTLSVEIAIASSLQIALFVAPLLVFISLIIGHPLTLVFNQLELIALIAGVLIAALVSADGESNWLEGAELLAIYIILGLTFFLMPT